MRALSSAHSVEEGSPTGAISENEKSQPDRDTSTHRSVVGLRTELLSTARAERELSEGIDPATALARD